MLLRFGDCELDTERYTLQRRGQPVAVQPRVLDLLIHLLLANGRVVSRAELHQAVWKGVVVSEDALSHAVKQARRAIGDDGAGQRLIQTVRGRGFRLAVPVAGTRTGAEPGPVPVDPFVGRRGILAFLEAELEAARAAGGRFVLLEGEPGIGKSRTLAELADRARARGFRVLVGRGVEGLGAPAYWPWTQALRQLLEADTRAPLPAEAARVIAHTLPELRALLPEAEEGPLPDPRSTREAHFRLSDALARTGSALAREKPLLLAFDDLHCTDRGTLSLLAYVLREIGSAPVLVVGTCRDASLATDAERARQVSELLREPRARSLRLAGLERSEVRELVAALREEVPADESLDDLMHRTGGNPFFVREIVALRGPFGGRGELPETVRQAILRHLDALPAPCRELLPAAAVLGRSFELEVLAALAAISPEETLARLDPAVAGRVLEANAAGATTYTFIHALIPETLVASLGPGKLRALHAEAARALEAHAARRPDRAMRIALHLVRAVPAVDRSRAVSACRDAAREARERFAYDEAVALLAQAVEVADAGPLDEAQELELRLELADAQLAAAQPEAARQTCRRTVERARRLGEAPVLARAALAFAGEQDSARLDIDAVSLLEEASRALGSEDVPLRARVLGRLAEALYVAPELARSEALSRDALSIARRCRDPVTLGHALKARHWSAWTPENLSERESIVAELLEVAATTGRAELEYVARVFAISNALERGDRAAAEAQYAAFIHLAERDRRLLFEWYLQHYQVTWHLLDGEIEAAEGALQRAEALGRRSGYEVATTWFAIQLYGVRRAQDRLAELEPVMRRLAREYPMTPWRLALAREDVRAGRTEEGWRALNEFLGDGAGAGSARAEDPPLSGVDPSPSSRVRRDFTFLVTLWHLSEICAELEASHAAGAVESLLRPFADRHVVVGLGMLYLGPVSQALALLARAQGRTDIAAAHLEQARARDLRAGALRGPRGAMGA